MPRKLMAEKARASTTSAAPAPAAGPGPGPLVLTIQASMRYEGASARRPPPIDQCLTPEMQERFRGLRRIEDASLRTCLPEFPGRLTVHGASSVLVELGEMSGVDPESVHRLASCARCTLSPVSDFLQICSRYGLSLNKYLNVAR